MVSQRIFPTIHQQPELHWAWGALKPNAGKKRFYPRRPSAIVHLSTIPRKSSISMVTSPIQQPKSCKIMQNSDLTVRNLHFNISTSFNTWCFSAEICFAHRPPVPWTRTRLVHRCHETWKGWAATVARRSLGNSSHPIFRCAPAVTPAFDIMFLMVSYGFLWFLMVSCGFLWFLMVSYGFLWFLMASYGFVWFRMVSYGFLWFLMVSYGFLWFLMVSYGFLWFLMVSYGFLGFLRVFYGFLWFLMVSYGFLWFLMVSYGVLWCLMVSCGVLWCLMVSYGVLWCLMVSYGFLWFLMVSYGFLWFLMVNMVSYGFLWFHIMVSYG